MGKILQKFKRLKITGFRKVNKIKETNSKYPLKGTLEQPDEIKTIQQDDQY